MKKLPVNTLSTRTYQRKASPFIVALGLLITLFHAAGASAQICSSSLSKPDYDIFIDDSVQTGPMAETPRWRCVHLTNQGATYHPIGSLTDAVNTCARIAGSVADGYSLEVDAFPGIQDFIGMVGFLKNGVPPDATILEEELEPSYCIAVDSIEHQGGYSGGLSLSVGTQAAWWIHYQDNDGGDIKLGLNASATLIPPGEDGYSEQFVEYVSDSVSAYCTDAICDAEALPGLQTTAGPIDIATGALNVSLPIMSAEFPGLLPISHHYSTLPILRKTRDWGLTALTAEDAEPYTHEEWMNIYYWESSWHHSYDKRLVYDDGYRNGYVPGVERVLLYVPSGDILIFVKSGGNWVPASHNNIRGHFVEVDKWQNSFNFVRDDGYTEKYENGKLSEIVYPDDTVLRFEYTLNSQYHPETTIRQSAPTPAVGVVIEQGYLGEVLSMRSLNNSSYLFEFDYEDNGAFGQRLASITRPDGSAITFSYDEVSSYDGWQVFPFLHDFALEGQPLQAYGYDDHGRASLVATSGAGQVSAVHANGRVTVSESCGASKTFDLATYTVSDYAQDGDTQYRIPRIEAFNCSNCGYSVSVGYATNGRISNVARTGTAPFSIDFNSSGLATTLESSGLTRNLEWDETHRRLTGLSGADVATTQLNYDGSQALSGLVSTAGIETRAVGVDVQAGKLRSLQGLGNNSLSLDYSTQGFISQLTNAENISYQFLNHNHLGQPQQLIDQNGVETTLDYDVMGRIKSIVRGGEERLHVNYNRYGMPEAVTVNGETLGYGYDNDLNLNKMSSACGPVGKYTYNACGLVESETVTVGNMSLTKRYDYDPEGYVSRITQNTPASNRVVDFNARGQVVSDKRDGNEISYGYDADGNLESLGSNGEQQATLVVGNDGRVESVNAAGGVSTAITHNGFGDYTGSSNTNWLSKHYTYSPQGNPDTFSTITRQEGYDFDNANRLKTRTFTKSGATTQTVHYGYDDASPTPDGKNYGIGELTHVDNPAVSYDYDYDADGNIKRQKIRLDPAAASLPSKEIGYLYNLRNLVTEVTYSSGDVLKYHRSACTGLVDNITWNGQPLANLQYGLGVGPATAIAFSNGTVVQRDFDEAFRLQELRTIDLSDNQLLWKQHYDYDARKNIQSISTTSTIAGVGGSQSFGYDTSNRLTSASGSYGDIGYDYDAAGNRTEITTNGDTQVYRYEANSDRLSRIEDINGNLLSGYQTDDDGAITQAGDLHLIYDAAGRLERVEKNSQTIAQYRYDPNGQRISKTADGHTLYFLYDTHGRLVEELDETGDLIRQYLYHPDGELLALISADHPQPVFVQNDHLGTPRFLTDANRNVVYAAQHKPFGATTVAPAPASVTPVAMPLRFPGQYYDAETGFHYNNQRYYDPALGRYLKADPIGLDGGLNVYAYVGSNPVNLFDPTGNLLKGLERVSEALIKAAEESVRIVNKRYAGTVHPKTGIPFYEKGFPDFSSVARATVTIKGTGNRTQDFILANKAAGFVETPVGYTWHHVEDTVTMQLVRTDIHDATRHTGGIAILKRAAAMATLLYSDISNASANDYLEFTAEMLTPLGLESSDAGGALYGPGTDYPTYTDYVKSLEQ